MTSFNSLLWAAFGFSLVFACFHCMFYIVFNSLPGNIARHVPWSRESRGPFFRPVSCLLHRVICVLPQDLRHHLRGDPGRRLRPDNGGLLGTELLHQRHRLGRLEGKTKVAVRETRTSNMRSW
jgi:hypothetical protein